MGFCSIFKPKTYYFKAQNSNIKYKCDFGKLASNLILIAYILRLFRTDF